MSLTAEDLGQIKEIVVASEERLEERLHRQMVLLGDRLDHRIDQTNMKMDVMRTDLTEMIVELAHSVQVQTNEIQSWHEDHERRITRLEQQAHSS